jgi:hypothetical protein
MLSKTRGPKPKTAVTSSLEAQVSVETPVLTGQTEQTTDSACTLTKAVMVSECSDIKTLQTIVLQLHQILEDLKTTDELAAKTDDNWYRRKATTIINTRSELLVRSIDGSLWTVPDGK